MFSPNRRNFSREYLNISVGIISIVLKTSQCKQQKLAGVKNGQKGIKCMIKGARVDGRSAAAVFEKQTRYK